MEQRKISFSSALETRDNESSKVLCGYFIKFNSETELYKGTFEKVAPEAITNSLRNNDIKCLFNHDAALVLGSTKNKTLTLKADNIGLWGEVPINEDDKQALDIYHRVKRGDIDKASFSFQIVKEDAEMRNGNYVYTLREIDLHEVSIVTFPAYQDTVINARKKQNEQLDNEQLSNKRNAVYLEQSKELDKLEKIDIDNSVTNRYSVKEMEALEGYPKKGNDSLRAMAFLSSLESDLQRKQEERDNLIKEARTSSQQLKNAVSEQELDISTRLTKLMARDIEKSNKELLELSTMVAKVRNTIYKSKGDHSNMERTEQKENLRNFIVSRGEQREGLKVTSSDVYVPEQLIYDPALKVRTAVNLEALVNSKKVARPSGTMPILKESTAILSSVEELAANPELAKPEFLEVPYSVATYRGAIPVSEEAIDDSEIDIVSIVLESANEQVRNTRNKKIADVLKTFTAKSVSNTDQLKDILNVDLSAGYTPEMVVSQSFFNVIDKLKDENGHYLYKDGKFSDIPLTKVPDTLLGTAGAKVAFIGDAYRAVLLTDRANLNLKWQDHNIYGRQLMAVTRFEAKKADENAGFFVTWTEAGA